VTAISSAAPTRRDFFYIATASADAVGAVAPRSDFAGPIQQGPATLLPYQFIADAEIRIGAIKPNQAKPSIKPSLKYQAKSQV
jgi:hypothetical protein